MDTGRAFESRDELVVTAGPGDGLCPLMRADALVAWVGSLDEARQRAAVAGTTLAITCAAAEQLRDRGACPVLLPADVRLIE